MQSTLVFVILALVAATQAYVVINGGEAVQPILVRHARAALPQRFGGFGGSASYANANSQSFGGGYYSGFPGAGFSGSASQASAGSQSFGGNGFFY